MEILTEEEHHAVELSAGLWNYINEHVVADGPTKEADLREIMAHIHGIQRAIMAQAAARAYPDQYRLLGGLIHDEKVESDTCACKGNGWITPVDACVCNLGKTAFHDCKLDCA